MAVWTATHGRAFLDNMFDLMERKPKESLSAGGTTYRVTPTH